MIGVVTYEVVVPPIVLIQYEWIPDLLDQPSDVMARPRVKRYTFLFNIFALFQIFNGAASNMEEPPFLAWEFGNELHNLYYGVERLPNAPVPPRERTTHIAAAL